MRTESVLLVNSPRHLVGIPSRASSDIRMPLGLMYIASYLKNHGIATSIVDAEGCGFGIAELVREIVRQNPTCIGLNCHTLNRNEVFEIARVAKAIRNETLIVLGGPHPTLAPKTTLQECSAADAVVVGEGEETLRRILENPKSLECVPGVAYMKNGVYARNSSNARLMALDDLPFPDISSVPLKKYFEYRDKALPGLWGRAYLVASRGCRFKCSFCTEGMAWNGSVTHRTAENVIAEINHYLSLPHKVTRFYFYDDTFTDWIHYREFSRLARDLDIEWSISTRIESLNAETIELLASGGCREIALGLESGSRHTLQRIRKNWLAQIATEQVGELVNQCMQLGIAPRTHFTIGYAWETQDDILATVQLANELWTYGLRDANFFPVKLYPGTPLDLELRQRLQNGCVDQLYDVAQFFDWNEGEDPRVAAKLRRFNDGPQIPLNPHLDSVGIRRLVRNCYSIFFSERRSESIESRLWEGVSWRH